MDKVQYVVISGDLLEGIYEIRGPFDTDHEAEAYMECFNMGHRDKFVHEVEAPKKVTS